MNWLARLQSLKSQDAPENDATNATKPQKGGFVAFVASYPGHIQKQEGGSVAFVASIPEHIQKREGAANDPTASPKDADPATKPDPDRWCWPHSTAMNTVELDTFTARTARFTDKGMGLDAAHRLADTLNRRDREQDDRRHCQECRGLSYGRCTRGMAVLDVLHRCDYFRG